MFFADRITKMAGVALLLLAALLVITSIVDTAAVGDANPLARGDTEALLADINDNQSLVAVNAAFNIAIDTVVLLVIAAVLYLLFRDRSRVLALFAAFGFLGAGVAFTAGDAGGLTLLFLAADFVEEGGPGGIATGDPVILESARVVSAFLMLSVLTGVTALGFGLIALGALLTWAPEGEVNPPRWLGALAILAGVGMFLNWVMAANWEIGVVFAFAGGILALLLLVILGGWLLMQPEPRVAARPTSGVAYEEAV